MTSFKSSYGGAAPLRHARSARFSFPIVAHSATIYRHVYRRRRKQPAIFYHSVYSRRCRLGGLGRHFFLMQELIAMHAMGARFNRDTEFD